MSRFESDERGLIAACPNCGQLNRLLFDKLGIISRCAKCRTSLLAPGDPIDIERAAQFDTLIAKSSIPVLVDFWAPSCGPCQMVAPEVDKVALEGAGSWLVIKLNTQMLPNIAGRFKIRGIPTFAIFRNGREVARQSGAMPAPMLKSFLNQALAR